MAARRTFTVKEKAEIISKLNNGENNADLCKKYKVSHSTISTMWKNRDNILECFESKSLKIKKNRKPTHQDVEYALLMWFKAQRSKNVPLSARLLQEKANHLAKLFGKMDFECSKSWIYRFRQRYDIAVGKVSGEAASVCQSDCDNWLKTVFPKLTEDYTDSQIWNADETAHPMISASLPGEGLPLLGQLGQLSHLYAPQPPAGMTPEFLTPPPRPFPRYAPRRPRDAMPAPPAPPPAAPAYPAVPGYAPYLPHPSSYSPYAMYRARAPPQLLPGGYALRPRHSHSGFVPPAPAPRSPPAPAPAPPPPRDEAPSPPENGAPAPHFRRGALIRLQDGSVRRVEEMRTEDFVTSAEHDGEHALTQCTLLRLEERADRLALTLTYDRNRTQAELESTPEHPFFVYGRGWASYKPERTLAQYGLRVQRLQVGDVCVSLVARQHAAAAAPTGASVGPTYAPPINTPLPTSAPPQTHPENLSVKEDSRKRRWSASDVAEDDRHPPKKR